MSDLISDDYAALIAAVKERVRAAQYEALRAVNQELVTLYWDLGKIISEREEESGWGQSIVERLSRDLQLEFPGVSGFSKRNLRYMRDFYRAYVDRPILQPMVAEIGWSHNVVIIEHCKDEAGVLYRPAAISSPPALFDSDRIEGR